MTQPLIFWLSYPELFWSLINVRYKTNLKVKYLLLKITFPKIPRCPSLWKTGYQNKIWPWKLGYRNRMCLSNIGTGTESGFQILVPEPKLVKPVFVPVLIFKSHFLFRYQYLKARFCSGNQVFKSMFCFQREVYLRIL